MISATLKRQVIDKAYRTKKYWYIITKVNDPVPKVVCAENIIIDPNIVIIEWIGSPYANIRSLEGYL